MLQIWDVNWYLDEAQCPCDVHFVQWIEATGLRDATAFHFGTGGHHHIGLANMQAGAPNTVLGITASPQEFDAFVKLAIEHPKLSRDYQVLFGDIYLLNAKLLPPINVATLFHLCEFRGDSQDAYGGLTDRQVIETLLTVMPASGKVMLYSGSFAFDKAQKLADDLVQEGVLNYVESFKSLRIYAKRQ